MRLRQERENWKQYLPLPSKRKVGELPLTTPRQESNGEVFSVFIALMVLYLMGLNRESFLDTFYYSGVRYCWGSV